MVQQSLRRFHPYPGQQILQLQRIHRRAAFKVIIGHHIDRLRRTAQRFNFLFPLHQLSLPVEVVIAVFNALGGKPLFVIAPVQPHVADARSHMLGRAQRTPDHWLIDIAKRHVVLSKHG